MSNAFGKIALYVDFENLETSVRRQYDTKVPVDPVLEELQTLGTVSVRRAYGDWVQHAGYRQTLLQAGFELIEYPNLAPARGGADIRLSLDALELALTSPGVTTFALVSGNNAFLPLLQKLHENNRQVIVVGVEASTSNVLRRNCDRYFALDTIANLRRVERGLPNGVLRLLERAIQARVARQEPLETLAIRTIMQQLDPGFNERNHGFANIEELFDQIIKVGQLPLRLETRDGVTTIQVTGDLPPPAPRDGRGRDGRDGRGRDGRGRDGRDGRDGRGRDSRDSRDSRGRDGRDGRRGGEPAPAPEPPKPQWETRPLTEAEWQILVEAVALCVREGEGRPNQGKLWIINAYLHRQRLDGKLQLANVVLSDALQRLAAQGLLVRPTPDTYLLAEDYDAKRAAFIAQQLATPPTAFPPPPPPRPAAAKPAPPPPVPPTAPPPPPPPPPPPAADLPVAGRRPGAREELDEQTEAEMEYAAKAREEARRATRGAAVPPPTSGGSGRGGRSGGAAGRAGSRGRRRRN